MIEEENTVSVAGLPCAQTRTPAQSQAGEWQSWHGDGPPVGRFERVDIRLSGPISKSMDATEFFNERACDWSWDQEFAEPHIVAWRPALSSEAPPIGLGKSSSFADDLTAVGPPYANLDGVEATASAELRGELLDFANGLDARRKWLVSERQNGGDYEHLLTREKELSHLAEGFRQRFSAHLKTEG